MKKTILFSALFISFFSFSQTLDPTFNGNGILTSLFTNPQSSESIIHSEMQTDGKMVYLGNYYEKSQLNGGLAGTFIARYNVDGTLDNSFNSCGFKLFKNDYSDMSVEYIPIHNFYDLKIQSDGKILVSGDEYLFRLNVDGSFDTTFGTNGHIQVPFNNNNITFNYIRIQTDNKIILGNGPSEIVVRINPDGSLDTTFDNDGIKDFNLNSPLEESINDIAIQADGKLVINFLTNSYTSSTSTTVYFSTTTLRINSDGSLDNSFGNNGVAIPLRALYFGFHSFISLQSDGKILVAGPLDSNSDVYRYNTDGSLDTTFNAIGNTSAFGQICNIKSLINGKTLIMVYGGIYINNNNSEPVFKIYKLNEDGSLDNSFATNGQFYSSSLFTNANTINLKNDGTIVLGGSFIDYTNYINDDTLLHRLRKIELSSDGVLQNSTTFNLKQISAELNGTIEQSDRKIIAFYNQNNLVRYNENGTIDTSFGTNGIVDLSGTYSNKIVQQPDGKFLLYHTGSSIIYRRNADGLLDSTFGTNGMLDLNFGFNKKICVTNDNKIIILNTEYSYFILKLNNDGTIDSSFVLNDFDVSGLFGRFNFFDENEIENSNNLIIQSDNKILIAVSLIGSNSAGFATGIIRLNSNGSLDTTFGNNGKIVIQENNYILPKNMCLLENDNFVINFDIGLGATKLYKYNNNGILDTNFNNIVTNDLFSINDVTVQPDFKILKSTNVNNQFTIERFDNITGDLDTTFANNGIMNTPIGLSSNIKELTCLQNNSLLASGTSFDGTNETITLVRYVNLSLGYINFVNDNSNFLIYPNPIQNEATFDFSLQNDESVSIEIIDMQGKLMQSILNDKELTKGNHKQTINLSNVVSAGNYILKFSSNKGSESIKIIKK